MSVKIGTVSTFADVKPNKAQAVKILEESAEVFSAWEELHYCTGETNTCDFCPFINDCVPGVKYGLVDECADVIQAVCNLLAALGVDDLTAVLDRCKQKNIERGRNYGILQRTQKE